MKIYNKNGVEILDAVVSDNSFIYREIMGENELTIYFPNPGYEDVPVGSYVDYKSERYTLMKPSNFKKNSTYNYEYTLVLNSYQGILKKYKYRNLLDKRLKFSLTAKPVDHLQLLIDNLNAREGMWSIGTCIDATEKVISYSMNNCMEALRAISDAFETEFEIVGKVISLKRVEYNKEYPLPLSYGKGNGLKPGVGRQNFGDKSPVEILFVQGGERNIDKSIYGSKELRLPISKIIYYNGSNYYRTEGTHYFKFNEATGLWEDQGMGAPPAGCRQYLTDEDGLSIRRNDKLLETYEEDSVDLTNIYPSFIGTVSGVTVVNEETNLYDFTDNSIPETLDFWDNRIAGEKMTVVFQDGMLAGKEFDINNYIHAERRFELVPQSIDGENMPNASYKPVNGNKYIVLGIGLPAAYIEDDTTKTGAAWAMFREAAKYLYENEDDQFTFTGELDGAWAALEWEDIDTNIVLGGTVLFSDPQFEEGALVRIKSIKELINDPTNLILDFSN